VLDESMVTEIVAEAQICLQFIRCREKDLASRRTRQSAIDSCLGEDLDGFSR